MHTLVGNDLYFDWFYFWNNISGPSKVKQCTH